MKGGILRTRRLVCGLALVGLCAIDFALAARPPSLHDPFDRILRNYVDAEGRVAYRALEKQSGSQLRAYLEALAEADPTALDEREQIAFWINAYNAAVLNGVLRGYDAEGVIARVRFFSWYSFRVAKAERTLEEIEHEILRKQFAEPRIHFALVCASTSCPVLRREAYRGAELDAQLDDQTRRFLGDPSRNRIGNGQLALSPIFDWFREDFDKAAGSVRDFVRRYRDVPDDADLTYLDYDWSLNAQPGQRPE
jgi:hypothetical protein